LCQKEKNVVRIIAPLDFFIGEGNWRMKRKLLPEREKGKMSKQKKEKELENFRYVKCSCIMRT
jgi:hypothetical protein